jgi:hypothetical protein
VTAFSPLVRRIEAAREGTVPADAAARADLAAALEAALLQELPDLEDVDVVLPPEPPWEVLVSARAPGLDPVERGAASLAAWATASAGCAEWHAAWTDGPLLTLDGVLRRAGATGETSLAVRVQLHPGRAPGGW